MTISIPVADHRLHPSSGVVDATDIMSRCPWRNYKLSLVARYICFGEDNNMGGDEGSKERRKTENGKPPEFVAGAKGQIVQEEGREKEEVYFIVYWKYIIL